MSLIRFGAPAALVLLLWLPVAVALARRRATPRGAVVLRLVAFALLIASLASPQVAGLARGQTVVFAVDFSDSISAESRQRAVQFVRAAARHRTPGDRIGVVVFGADAIVEEAPAEAPALAFTSQPAGEATNLADAIRAALAMMPGHGARRIIVVTDGNTNRGDLSPALTLARSQEVEISVVPLLPAHASEVLVEQVQVPSDVRVGEQFLVRVAVQATAPAQVRLRVAEGETVIDQRTLAVRPGRTIVALPRVAQTEGVLHYEASIAATPDGTPENNRAEALVAVRGVPLVRYVARAPGVIAKALSAQGIGVVTISPEALPSTAAEYRGTAAVVLDDLPATQLSMAQMAALRDFVGQQGGGLLAVGGPHSFGVGGYAGTPLEEVLPVSMDVRHRLAIPSMAIILVIDTSGSMGSFGQQMAKVDLAKETAQSVVDLLGERDIIGVIAFDQEPRWLVPPVQARQREQVLDHVSRVQAGGGTNMHPALLLAYNYLRRSQAKVRHVIVLSDGQTDPGDFQGLATRMAREKITVSSVAIGTDADEQIMQNVARWGGGRYYLAKDAYTIPQIMTAEALLASQAYIVAERFPPQIARGGLLDDFAFPPLRGYVATVPKPASTIHLLSPQEDPILATWQYGLGRAVAFTSDATSRWAADWMSWSDLARFWSHLVRWVGRDETEELQVRVEQGDGAVAVILDVYTTDGEPVDGLVAQARVVGPAGRRTSTPLVQSAPGRYEGRISAVASGAYAVTVAATDAAGTTRTRTTGFVIPYSPELRDLSVNQLTLLQVAEATGGRILDDPKSALAPDRAARGHADVWPPLAATALGLFVLEIAARRLPVLGHHVATITGAVLARVRRRPSEEEIEEDRQYAEADRWKLVEREPTASSESMEMAARLYIARLKAMQRDDEGKKE